MKKLLIILAITCVGCESVPRDPVGYVGPFSPLRYHPPVFYDDEGAPHVYSSSDRDAPIRRLLSAQLREDSFPQTYYGPPLSMTDTGIDIELEVIGIELMELNRHLRNKRFNHIMRQHRYPFTGGRYDPALSATSGFLDRYIQYMELAP